MNRQPLEFRELAAWGFDPQADRGSLPCEHIEKAAQKSQRRMEARNPHLAESPISFDETETLAEELAERRLSIVASGEFEGLVWQTAIVDLRKLIAFQRRIGFANDDQIQPAPERTDHPQEQFDQAR